MPAQFKVTVDQPAWLRMIRDKQRPVAEAAVAALRETAANAVQEGRQDIAAAGPGFTRAKWQSGLQYRTKEATEGGEPSLQATATIFHKYGIAGVFEHGATIQGKPMLWIPTTHGGATASRSGKKLVSATVRGKPMLFDANDKSRDRKPLYIGVPSVRIPKKFHITEIVKKHAAKIGLLFIKFFKGDK
ncbi:MAG TPA: DUF6441 family protein [Verrucomicrobiae bacterium]|nr:DUF6441 family protein [Verrucomicrobiae bacterium]